MTFQTIAAISLTVEFVVISAIILTLLNAVTHGRILAAVRQVGRARQKQVVSHPADAAPVNQKDAASLRKAA
jgi:Na+-translocating ferredoxin:NAD+ oxidoreductase RnfG subunit